MAIQTGAEAPDFTLKNQNDEDWTLSAHRGSTIVLLWYPLDWSPTCEKEHCSLGQEIDLGDSDAVIVGISRDSVWSHKAWRATKGIQHDLLADPMLEVTRQYDLVHPHAPFISHRATVIVNKSGDIVFSEVQENTGAERDWGRIKAALASLE